jgi:hypothetical protein
VLESATTLASPIRPYIASLQIKTHAANQEARAHPDLPPTATCIFLQPASSSNL